MAHTFSRHYERLYAEARSGSAPVPWDHGEPTPYLVAWLRAHFVAGTARGRAVVVGCAYGDDAELVASYGFGVTAFDVSPTAVEVARERHPVTTVDYRRADLLALPPELVGVYDRDEDPPGPPWLLHESEVRHVATGDVHLARLRRIGMHGGDRWVGEFQRDADPVGDRHLGQ